MKTKIQSTSKRGGKRPGAGRPATGRTTKVARIPLDFPDIQDLEDVINTLRQWKKDSDKASIKNSRWYYLRKLLNELPESVLQESDS